MAGKDPPQGISRTLRELRHQGGGPALASGGPFGLDYTAILATASLLGITRRDLTDIFPDPRVMAVEPLAVMVEAG